jgi:hypothetical protein
MRLALDGRLLRAGSAPRQHHVAAVISNANRARFPGDTYRQFGSVLRSATAVDVERLLPN